MKALLAILTLSALMLSCGNEEVIDDPGLPKETASHEGGDLRSRAVRHVEAQLNIAGTERYSLSIIRQNLEKLHFLQLRKWMLNRELSIPSGKKTILDWKLVKP